MSYLALCDGWKGLGNPECRAQVLCGESAETPPALGWQRVRDASAPGELDLCARCWTTYQRWRAMHE